MQSNAEKYAKAVIKGKILSCKWVKAACERYFDDLKTGKKRGIFFDHQSAELAIEFFSYLKHSKGNKWAGKVFELEPWQEFIIWNIFGWKRKSDGLRRFRTIYLEVPRKNGKSTLVSAIGLVMFFADGEAGAEVYTAATKRDQALITHSEASRMVQSSPHLKSRINVYRNNLSVPATNSKFEPLGADADTMDGLNVHCAILDEVHAHKTRAIWDVLETATGARQQPLIIAITTAGFDRQSICWEQHEYVEKLLSRNAQDDSYFGIIYTLDDGDDWKDPKVWAKANPNLGVSVFEDDLERKVRKAKEMPLAQNNFLRKHLDVWTQQNVRWIDHDLWAKNFKYKIDEERLKGKLCYGGLDLAAVDDLAAWILIFPQIDEAGDEWIDVVARFWASRARLFDRSNKYRDSYQAWERQGYLITTDRDAIEYEDIKAVVLNDAKKFALDSVNVDRLFQGYQLSMELEQEGMKIAGMGMGYLSMAGPVNEFDKMLLKKQINHGNNPILAWMADNIEVSQDPAGNRKPNKATSQGKIDGIVGILLALDRKMRLQTKRSKYEEKGMAVV